jgi:hypothetical protein
MCQPPRLSSTGRSPEAFEPRIVTGKTPPKPPIPQQSTSSIPSTRTFLEQFPGRKFHSSWPALFSRRMARSRQRARATTNRLRALYRVIRAERPRRFDSAPNRPRGRIGRVAGRARSTNRRGRGCIDELWVQFGTCRPVRQPPPQPPPRSGEKRIAEFLEERLRRLSREHSRALSRKNPRTKPPRVKRLRADIAQHSGIPSP